MTAPFTEYVALGDSNSIDLYAALDAGATDVAVALERLESVGAVAPIGAASLLYRNDETRYPDELGNDLWSLDPSLRFRRLATDGATIGDVFGEQLARLGPSDDPTLITLTIGSEDLFSAVSGAPKKAMLERIVSDLIEAYDLLLGAIRAARPNALVVVTTVCDPSDRTGRIPGILEDIGRLPLSGLDAFNIHLRETATGAHGLVLADPYVHFLGRGATAPEEDRWYWRRAPIELNARGAHELRMVWLDALRSVGTA